MPLFKKLLKLGGIVSLLTFVILSAAFLVVWARPNLVLKTSTMKWALKYMPSSIGLQFAELNLDSSSLSFFRKQIVLTGKDVCLKMPGAGFESCFEGVSIRAEIDIFGWFPSYTAGPIELKGGRLAIRPVPDVKTAPATGPGLERDTIWPTPPSFLKSVKLAGARIEILSLDYGVAPTTAQFEGTLVGKPDGTGSSWKLESAGDLETGKDVYKFGADVALKSIGDPWFGPYYADLNTSLLLPDGRGVAVQGNARPRGAAEVDYALDVKYRDRDRRVAMKTKGQAGLSRVTAELDGDIKNAQKYLPSIGVHGCKIDVSVPEDKKSTNAKLDCPVKVATSFPALANGPYAQIIDSMAMLIRVDGKMFSEKGKEQSIDGNVEIKMDHLLAKVRHGSASLKTNVKGSVANFPSQLEFDTNLELAVEEFQKVVSLFENFPWAVPVPINSLKGPIGLQVSAKGKLATARGVDCPIVFRTRLKSPSQKLDLDGDGKLTVKKTSAGYQSHVDFKLVLADIRMVLPYLNLGAPPRFMPDARIHDSTKKPTRVVASKGPKSFTYRIVVETPPSKPIQLSSNLAKGDVPITMSLLMTDEVPFSGSMRIANFDMELFRRTAQVHHIYLGFRPNPDETEIDGEIRVAYTDYTVKIKLIGLLAEPEVKLVSEPALPENEIWAVLLYGRRLASLDSGEASSVGSASAAVADQAVSLASMYVLASTPVESIGYDPATGVFKAKVRLADGTSLNVGTDLQRLQQVGVRQRLGKNWYINTYLENPLEPLRQSLTTFLEWSIGY